MDLARFGAWLQTKLDRLSAKRLTVGGVTSAAVTFGAFVAVTITPVMRSEKLNWGSSKDLWKALTLSWLALAAALYLKYSEAFKRTRAWNKMQRQRRTSRQIHTGKAIKDLCEQLHLDPKERSPEAIRDIRETILQSAAIGLEELLNLTQHQHVTASLLEFCSPDFKRMRVTARSSRDRSVGLVYAVDNLVGWKAIRDGRIRLIDDVTRDPRWEGIEGKTYRSVAAVPVGYGGKACAAISIDSAIPYAFYGRLSDIAIQLEPYAVTLALTYGPDAVYHPCTYDPSCAA